MEFNNYKTFQFERRGKVLEVTFNRPDKLNAVDEQMHAELATLFTDISNDPDSQVIVLTGAGRAFSAGGDIDWMQKMIDIPNSFEKTAREAKQIINTLLDCQKPILAKINGHATGLGATIALFCDVIFASESAKIGDPHVSVGLVAGDGGAGRHRRRDRRGEGRRGRTRSRRRRCRRDLRQGPAAHHGEGHQRGQEAEGRVIGQRRRRLGGRGRRNCARHSGDQLS